MSGPWEAYQQPQEEAGPWAQYGAPPEPTVLEKVKRKADVAGSGFLRGAAGMPALMGDLANASPENLPPSPITTPMQGMSALVRKFLPVPEGKMPVSQAVQKIGVQPETTGEKYLASGMEGLGGALTGGGGASAPLRTSVTGIASGLGAEAGGQLTGDSFFGRLAGSLLGGAGAAKLGELVNRVRPQSGDLAKDALQGITEQQMRAAEALQRTSRQRGVDMDLAQALEAVGAPAQNLSAIRNALANSKYGEGVKSTLQRQNAQLSNLADESMDALPGQLRTDKSTSANLVADAATERMRQARQARTDAVTPIYERAGQLQPEEVQRLTNTIDNLMNQPGRTDDFLTAARRMRARLAGVDAPEAREVETALEALNAAKTPRDRALAANRVSQANARLAGAEIRPIPAADADVAISDAVGPYKPTPLNPRDPKVTGQINYLAGQVRNELADINPTLRQASNTYRQISEEQVNPLKRGIVGQIAGPQGSRPDVQASAAKLENLFAGGSDTRVARDAREIPTLFRELREVDPEAVPAAAKSFIRQRLDKAFPAEPGIQTRDSNNPVNAAKAIQDSLFGDRRQMEGMRDIVRGIADSFELDEAGRRQLLRGLDNFAQTTRGLANRPGSVGGLNWADISKTGGKSYLADAARIYGFLPFERVARRMEDATLSRTFRDFDQILTTPDGMDMLRRLGQVPPNSNMALYLMAQFGSLPATSQPQVPAQQSE